MENEHKIKLIIADDDSLIRESLSIIIGLDCNIEVLGAFKNGQEAVKYCSENPVDIALLDVRMPVMNGIEAGKEIMARYADTKIIILTTFDEDEYISQAVKSGVMGYILKNSTPEKIINTIKMVYSGNSVMQEEIMKKISQGFEDRTRKEYIKKEVEKLTEREIEVVREIGNGLSNKEIGERLYISEGTVKNYITSILAKTSLKHRTQIAIWCIENKI